MMVLLVVMRSKPTQASAMVDKCTLFTFHTYICIYSYKIQNTVDCHPDNDWATIPCLLLAPWLASWLAVFCSLTNMMQDPIAAVGTCQIWKTVPLYVPLISASQNGATVSSDNRAVVGISMVCVAGGLKTWGDAFCRLFSQFSKIHTTCRNVPAFEVGAAYLSLLLIDSLSGHRQRRQRKHHHPLDRLRTSSSEFSRINFSVKMNLACLSSVTSTALNYTEMV